MVSKDFMEGASEADMAKMFAQRMGSRASRMAKMMGGSPKKDASKSKKKSRGPLADLFGGASEPDPSLDMVSPADELGELANIDVVDDAPAAAKSGTDDAPIRKTWKPKACRRQTKSKKKKKKMRRRRMICLLGLSFCVFFSFCSVIIIVFVITIIVLFFFLILFFVFCLSYSSSFFFLLPLLWES